MLSYRCSNLSKIYRPLSTFSLVSVEKCFKSGRKIIVKDFACWTSFTKPQFQTNKVSVCKYSTQVKKVLEKTCTKTQSPEAVDASEEAEKKKMEEIFEEIAEGDPNVAKQLKILHFEYEILREQNHNVPASLRKSDWLELLKLKSIGKRRKYLNFLFINEKKKENKELKKKKLSEERQEAYEKMKEEGHLEYNLGKNAMFLRIYDKSLNRLNNERLMGARMFSQTVVFDCSYESYMTVTNCRYCVQQMALCFSENRGHPAPFHIELCNVDKEGMLMKQMPQFIPNALIDSFPWDFHTESLLERYPKDKLVYLSPHARYELHDFNHEDIYIIGAFVDKGTGVKASLAKAKKYNLRMAKLPLDSYLQWEKGVKSLPLNIVLRILLDQRLFDSWEVAFNNVPRRFLIPPIKKEKKIIDSTKAFLDNE